jgi:peptide/nickel transport system ATP-binding protein
MALQIKALSVEFALNGRTNLAVDNVSLNVTAGRVLGVVGESGAGKSTLAFAILGLIDPPGRIVGGEIWFKGRDLLQLGESGMRSVRGRQISIVFQNPATALNPTMTLGDHIIETIQEYTSTNRGEARRKAIDILKNVDLGDQEDLLRKYPHQISGGMKQRVMIALAMSHEPAILIADEPTSALDVVNQAQILRLLRDLNHQFKTTIVIITHNLAVVAEACDDVACLYAGRVMESGDVRTVFGAPAHPYTQALLKAVPDIEETSLPEPIPGELTIRDRPERGCVFHTRCSSVMDICRLEDPPLLLGRGGQKVYCYLYADANADERNSG